MSVTAPSLLGDRSPRRETQGRWREFFDRHHVTCREIGVCVFRFGGVGGGDDFDVHSQVVGWNATSARHRGQRGREIAVRHRRRITPGNICLGVSKCSAFSMQIASSHCLGYRRGQGLLVGRIADRVGLRCRSETFRLGFSELEFLCCDTHSAFATDFALLIAIANIGGRKLGKFRPRLHIAEPRSAVISDVSFSCLDHRLVSARCSAGPSGKRSIALFVARPCGDSVKSAARSGLRHHHSANRQIRRLRGSNVRCEEWTRHRV